MSSVKTCTRCKIEQPLDQFNRDKKRKDGKTSHCKSCVSHYCKTRQGKVDRDVINKMSREWKRNNPDKMRAMWLKQIYKLSWDDYESLYKSQQGCCSICNTPLKLHRGLDSNCEVAVVDHCHTSGKVCGLLCKHCNTAIGLLKENHSIIARASEYVKEHKIAKAT